MHCVVHVHVSIDMRLFMYGLMYNCSIHMYMYTMYMCLNRSLDMRLFLYGLMYNCSIHVHNVHVFK